MRRAALGIAAVTFLLAVDAGSAGAHVLLQPGRVPPASFRLFTVLSPDEAQAPLTGLSWQGGRTPPGHLALFRFSALAPRRPGAITLVGVQTFADGSTRIWRSARLVVADPPGGDGGRSGWDVAGAATAGLLLGALLVAAGAPAVRRVRR